MKKRNFIYLGIIFSLLFVSCQSTEVSTLSMEPLAFLSQDSSIYVGVPVKQHKELTAILLCAEIPGLSEKDAKTIAEHIEVLYAGLGTVKDRSRLEFSASHKIPQVAVKHVLSKKNGWSVEKKEFDNSEDQEPFLFDIYERPDVDFKFSLPDPVTFACAKDIDTLLSRVQYLKNFDDTPWNNWIYCPTDDILFYITKPGQYLRNLIGTSVSGVDSVWGTVSYKPDEKSSDYSGKYSVTLYLHLKDPRAVKAFNSFLSLSFAMMGGTVNQVDSNTIELSDVEISSSQIRDLFTRDPITGKHFKVVGDSIITEKR